MAGRQSQATMLATRAEAERLASALGALMLRAQRIAASISHGLHGRRRAGPGEEFWQYRAYLPGDAAQMIDWRKSARSERLYVRETEWMAANTLWLWVQSDAGMFYRSHLAEEEKFTRAVVLALALAMLARRGGERIAALGAPFAPDHTNAAIERMAHWWLRAAAGADGHGEALPPRAPLARHSTCVLIGDFFADERELDQRIAALAAQGARGVLLQLVDPAEETFPFQGRVRFIAPAGAQDFLSERAEDLRAQYRQALSNLRARLTQLAQRHGWRFLVHRSDAAPQSALLALVQQLDGQQATGW